MTDVKLSSGVERRVRQMEPTVGPDGVARYTRDNHDGLMRWDEREEQRRVATFRHVIYNEGWKCSQPACRTCATRATATRDLILALRRAPEAAVGREFEEAFSRPAAPREVVVARGVLHYALNTSVIEKEIGVVHIGDYGGEFNGRHVEVVVREIADPRASGPGPSPPVCGTCGHPHEQHRGFTGRCGHAFDPPCDCQRCTCPACTPRDQGPHDVFIGAVIVSRGEDGSLLVDRKDGQRSRIWPISDQGREWTEEALAEAFVAHDRANSRHLIGQIIATDLARIALRGPAKADQERER